MFVVLRAVPDNSLTFCANSQKFVWLPRQHLLLKLIPIPRYYHAGKMEMLMRFQVFYGDNYANSPNCSFLCNGHIVVPPGLQALVYFHMSQGPRFTFYQPPFKYSYLMLHRPSTTSTFISSFPVAFVVTLLC